MTLDKNYDLVVIGGGPAGYAAAIRTGQLGKRVLCIEMERAGGTCLNWGCIPSKALLKSAELYKEMLNSDAYGFTCDHIKVDFAKVMKRSRGVADKMGGGIEFLFKKNHVDYIVGKAQMINNNTIVITEGVDKGKEFHAKNVLIATGCKAKVLPDLKVDGKRIMTSREALAMTEKPNSIVILGAGAIGVEFAYFLNSFGCKVSLVEMLDNVVPVEDQEISKALERSFKKQGIDVYTGVKAEAIKSNAKGVTLTLKDKKGSLSELAAESLLLAVGVTPNTDGLLAKGLELKLDRGYIVVNDRYETNLKNVYAAGDIIGPPWLAHVATFEALQAVNAMFGIATPKRVRLYPGCTYCQPQVASIGLSEEKAKEKGLKYKVGKFPFTASGKAVAVNHSEGFVKLLVDEQYGEILGAHIIGNDATELITEYALAMNTELTAEDIHHTIHAHPTMSESLAEAAADVYGEAIHV